MTENFDNRIREQLADYSPEVPSRIWDNIANRKKKRRGAFWFWLSSNGKPMLIAASLILAGIIIADVAIQKRPGSISKIVVSSGASKENISENGRPSTSDRERKSAETGIAAGAGLSNTAGGESTARNEKSAQTAMGSATARKNREEGGAGKSAPAETHSAAKATGIAITAEARTETVSEGAAAEKIRKRNPRNIRSSSIHLAAQENSGTDKTPEIKTEEPVVDFESGRTFSRTTESFSFMMRKTPAAWTPQATGITTGTIPCPEDNAAANKKYLEFYIGPDYTLKTYRDTANSQYLQKRKESTSNSFAFSAGARFTKVFNNAMSIRSGVNYSLITEKFETIEGNVIKVIYILDANNDTIGNYSTRVNIYRTTYNKYHSLDIPLAIGYEFGNGNLHGNINAGVIANIYSWQKGSTLDDTYKSVSISTGGPSSPYQFKTNMGISFAAAMSLYYKFENRIQLIAEPYIRYSLSPANKEEITLRQKFHTIGLRLGIRYDLNKILE